MPIHFFAKRRLSLSRLFKKKNKGSSVSSASGCGSECGCSDKVSPPNSFNDLNGLERSLPQPPSVTTPEPIKSDSQSQSGFVNRSSTLSTSNAQNDLGSETVPGHLSDALPDTVNLKQGTTQPSIPASTPASDLHRQPESMARTHVNPNDVPAKPPSQPSSPDEENPGPASRPLPNSLPPRSTGDNPMRTSNVNGDQRPAAPPPPPPSRPQPATGSGGGHGGFHHMHAFPPGFDGDSHNVHIHWNGIPPNAHLPDFVAHVPGFPAHVPGFAGHLPGHRQFFGAQSAGGYGSQNVFLVRGGAKDPDDGAEMEHIVSPECVDDFVG